MSIKVIIPGALSTIQDGGRFGAMATGFTPSGAADRRAFTLGNLLVGNTPDAASIEMTLMGMGVQFLSDCFIAVTGADMQPHINGNKVSSYKAISVKKGDYLYCEPAKSGCRAYLSVSGGIATEPVMGSRSTSLKLGIGGFLGRQLKPGDIVPTGKSLEALSKLSKRVLKKPEYSKDVTLLCVSGPQDDMFSDEMKARFYSQTFSVTPASDRMGIRLSGEPVTAENGVDIISDGITSGSVQIPKDGNPIILIADHQTTGGYAKLATVISTSLPLAAQLTPGCKVRFKETTVTEAQRLYKEEMKEYLKLQKQWK